MGAHSTRRWQSTTVRLTWAACSSVIDCITLTSFASARMRSSWRDTVEVTCGGGVVSQPWLGRASERALQRDERAGLSLDSTRLLHPEFERLGLQAGDGHLLELALSQW